MIQFTFFSVLLIEGGYDCLHYLGGLQCTNNGTSAKMVTPSQSFPIYQSVIDRKTLSRRKAPSVRLCTTTFSFVSFSDCGSKEVLLVLKKLCGGIGAQGQQRQGLRLQAALQTI